MADVNELDFTMEFYSDIEDKQFEARLMEEAESRLRALAQGHSDLPSASVNIRKQASGETPLYEATVVAYARPDHLAGTEKDESPTAALQGALEAVERQLRQKRERLRERWEEPGNDPVTKEMVEVVAAEEAEDELAEDAGEEGIDAE